MGMIGGLIKFFGSLFGWMQKRQELRNDPLVQKAVSAQQETDKVSKLESAVVKQDVAAVRNELAE